jgi:LacI family transcriptional regulator
MGIRKLPVANTRGVGRAKVATVKDVAAKAGVAPATVSNVLTARRPVTEELRQRVLEAAAALDYRPNPVAASLRTQQTKSIGIVVPSLENPFFAALVRRVEDGAAESGYQALIAGSNEIESQELARIQALVTRRVDGLIVAPTGDDVSRALPSRSRPPTVLVDRGYGAPGFDTITADSFDGAYKGAQYLLQLGHRDIAFLATDTALGNIHERVEGYRRAMAEAGQADRVRVIDGGVTSTKCRYSLEQVLRDSRRPTAVFGAAYAATLGAIQAIRAVDLAFPMDISLLGFDDSEWMTALRPYVSTVRQPIENMAAGAWKQLHARLDGSAKRHLRMRMPCVLEMRESTVAPTKIRRRR